MKPRKLLTKYREHLGALCEERVDPLIWTLRIKGLTRQRALQRAERAEQRVFER